MSEIETQPGAVFTAVAEGLPSGLADTLTFGVKRLPEGTFPVAAAGGNIVEFPQGGDVSNYAATRTMPDDVVVAGVGGVTYETAWPDDLVDAQEPFVIGVARSLATVDLIAIRLGRSFSVAEEAQVAVLIDDVSGLIAAAAGKTDEWLAAYTPVPRALRALCVEVVIRALSAPGGVALTGETIGTYSYTQEVAAAGLELTAGEVERVRRIVFGRVSDGSALETVVNDPIVQIRFPQLGAGSSILEQLGEGDPAAYIGGDEG